MKVFAAFFSLLLFAASFFQVFCGPDGSDLPHCCVSYTRHKLPQKLILRYYRTSTRCNLPAIVFITKRGRLVCGNPSDTWVQSYLQNLKKN